MNLPNKLTLLRIILVPFVIFFIMLPKAIGLDDPKTITVCAVISAAVFLIAALTDLLDGKIARKHNIVTDFGKFMDPIADKLLVFGAYVAFIYAYDQMSNAMVWIVSVQLLREFAVSSVRMLASKSDGTVIAAGWLGKVKTVTQCVSVLIIILEPVILKNIAVFSQYRVLSWISLAVMLFFAIYSGIDYIVSYWKYITPNK